MQFPTGRNCKSLNQKVVCLRKHLHTISGFKTSTVALPAGVWRNILKSLLRVTSCGSLCFFIFLSFPTSVWKCPHGSLSLRLTFLMCLWMFGVLSRGSTETLAGTQPCSFVSVSSWLVVPSVLDCNPQGDPLCEKLLLPLLRQFQCLLLTGLCQPSI